MLKWCISHLFTTACLFLNWKPCKTHISWTLSVSKPSVPWFARWHRCVDQCVNVPYWPGRSGNGFFVRVLTILFCIGLLLGEMLDLHDMDFMEATCMFYVKVGTVVQLEQRVICILTATGLEIVVLTAQLDFIFSLWLMYVAGKFF